MDRNLAPPGSRYRGLGYCFGELRVEDFRCRVYGAGLRAKRQATLDSLIEIDQFLEPPRAGLGCWVSGLGLREFGFGEVQGFILGIQDLEVGSVWG